ncbi:MAG: glycosyltransferase [Muribaculaceae bacterium]|nr:glycosyltransferase [Muribaculaceae bacterium]
MKLLQIIPSLEIGGAQRLLSNLIPEFIKDNEVEILVFQKTGSDIEKEIEKLGVKINSLEVGLHSIKAIKGIRKYLKRFDLAHIHLFPANYFTVIANLGINKPLLFTEHSTHNKRRNYKILKLPEKIVYSGMKKVACISLETENNLRKWISETDREHTLVIHNGIDLQKFEKASSFKSEDFFGKKGKPVLMVSRFTHSKDHDTLIRALRHVKDNNVFIVFAGDGSLLQEKKQLVKNLGLEERVIFLGARADIPQIIKSSLIGVQSSHWEGFGLTAIEMMAGGIPVIVNDTDGLKQVTGDGALVFKTGDEKQLAGLIEKLIEDADLYKEMQLKGKKRSGLFSIKETARKYLDLYQKLISG